MTLPLARAGHRMDSFDVNPFMLERLERRLKGGGYPFVTCRRMDGCKEAWGEGYDVVLLAANLLVNLVTQDDYRHTQRLFLRRAAEALRSGGHLFLDFDCLQLPEAAQVCAEPWICFEGTDDRGVFGRYIVQSDHSTKNPRLKRCPRRFELMPHKGAAFAMEVEVMKYFPSFMEVSDWLAEAGLRVDRLYLDYRLCDNACDGHRVTVWAIKD